MQDKKTSPRLTVCLDSLNSIYHEEWAFAKATHAQGRGYLSLPCLYQVACHSLVRGSLSRDYRRINVKNTISDGYKTTCPRSALAENGHRTAWVFHPAPFPDGRLIHYL